MVIAVMFKKYEANDKFWNVMSGHVGETKTPDDHKSNLYI